MGEGRLDYPAGILGLTTAEVAERHRQGQSNYVRNITSRPVTEILRANIFTIFNGILTAAIVVVLLVGQWQDVIFGLVMVINAAIGVGSELRSKKALDSVAVLETPRAMAWRDGELQEIPSLDIVRDDVLELHLGDQVPADGIVLEVHGLEIDESILTGESLPVRKAPRDEVLSGTAVVAGSGTMRVVRIGEDSWAQRITAEAKVFSLAVSEIQHSINKILRWITWLLPVVVAMLYLSQVRDDPSAWRMALIAAVAGVVGMIPQGLVLLTSMNFGLAAQKMARRGVLVQELPAVEILARVDYLCLDKTGTLTTGGISGRALHLLTEVSPADDDTANTDTAALAVLARMTEDGVNASASAILQMVRRRGVDVDRGEYREIPFSSVRKWSALIGPDCTWTLGAPEILLANAPSSPVVDRARSLVEEASANGNRTLCLSLSALVEDGENLPEGLVPMVIAELEEDVRGDAASTLDYFHEQGVKVVVISGDSTATVKSIAQQVGLKGSDDDLTAIDARALPESGSPEFDRLATACDIFGRVSPEQKRALVSSMRRQGHTVAMTGDGVNDALALKEADLGIAMGNGAPATKAVSRMVLLNGQFSVLPGVVAEGRRIIANMERVSSLFLTKTTYAMLLAIVVSITGWIYPFLPRHLTYIGWFTIGIPAFVLALGPNTRRYVPGFLRRTLLIAIPSGVIIGTVSISAYMIVGEGTTQGQTAATLTLIAAALWLLGITARPIDGWRAVLMVAMASGAIMGPLIPPVRNFFALGWPTLSQILVILGLAAIGCLMIELSRHYTAPIRESIGKDMDYV